MKTGAWVVELVLTGAVCSAGTASAATMQVHLFGMSFSLNPSGQPVVSDIVINDGDTVEWVWDQGFHSTTSVVGSAEVWNSTDHVPPFTFQHRFTKLGKFWYYCDIHGFDNGDGTAGGMSGTVTVNPLPGDINQDGHVDSADLLLLAGCFGTRVGSAGYSASCDLNNDGAVDISDLLILAGNWNVV